MVHLIPHLHSDQSSNLAPTMLLQVGRRRSNRPCHLMLILAHIYRQIAILSRRSPVPARAARLPGRSFVLVTILTFRRREPTFLAGRCPVPADFLLTRRAWGGGGVTTCSGFELSYVGWSDSLVLSRSDFHQFSELCSSQILAAWPMVS